MQKTEILLDTFVLVFFVLILGLMLWIKYGDKLMFLVKNQNMS